MSDKEDKIKTALDNQAAHRKESQQHKFAKSDLENQLRDANSKLKLAQTDLIKTKEELSKTQDQISSTRSNKDLEYAQLEAEKRRLSDNLTRLTYESEAEIKRLKSEVETIVRQKQV